jgi:hypothetical protein
MTDSSASSVSPTPSGTRCSARSLTNVGHRDRAEILVQAGLARSADYAIDDHRHFLLHHRGRCYTEPEKIAGASDCDGRLSHGSDDRGGVRVACAEHAGARAGP